MRTVFLRALDVEDKGSFLRAACKGSRLLQHELDVTEFGAIRGSPFAYWVPRTVREVFKRFAQLEREGRMVRQGGVTGNDARFVRLWWEVHGTASGERAFIWCPFAKGGRMSPWYSDQSAVVPWDRLRTTFWGYTGLLHRSSEKPSSYEHYFAAALTWPLRAARFVPVPLGRGSIFSIRGYALLAPEEELLSLAALLNSAIFDYVFKCALGRFGFPEFVVGVLQGLPCPEISESLSMAFRRCSRTAWSLRRSTDTARDTSHAFTVPALLQTPGDSLSCRAAAWRERLHEADAAVARIQSEIDELCFALFGISEADRRAIAESVEGANGERPDPNSDEGDGEGAPRLDEDAATLTADLVSWAVGVAGGRFDLRLATGTRPWPVEPQPFDPLPGSSPGMLAGGDGLPLAIPPTDYPLAFPPDGVLVDDPGHARDLAAAVRRVFDLIFGRDADAWWHDVSTVLDPKGRDLRRWLAQGFFEHHLKRHSRSRRKAPIVWQLGTPSGSYSIWLYAHRLSRDRFFQVGTDLVTPKLQHEERQLQALREGAGPTPSASARREIAAQETFVEELRSFREEVARIAPLWNPDLDDGIVITMAPLWRLVPQHKPWQRELLSCWESLRAGDYDWSHLAMHLWPERVVPKCCADRSLAIAHGLESEFWEETKPGKWQPRKVAAAKVDELVSDRTSPAVKSALADLMAARVPGGTKRMGRSRGRSGKD